MKRPGFFHGVIVAAVLGFFASAIVATLTPFVGLGTVVRLLIPLLGLAYVLYLLSQSAERLGRVTTLTCWIAMTAVAWWATPPLTLYLLIHVGAVWLIRSLYFSRAVDHQIQRKLGLAAADEGGVEKLRAVRGDSRHEDVGHPGERARATLEVCREGPTGNMDRSIVPDL